MYVLFVGDHQHFIIGKQIIGNLTVNITSNGPTPAVAHVSNFSSTKNTTNNVTTSQTRSPPHTNISWIAAPIAVLICFCILLIYAFTCAVGLYFYHKNEDNLLLGTLCCPCYAIYLSHKFGSYCYGSNESYIVRCVGTTCCPCYTLYKCGLCETNKSIL